LTRRQGYDLWAWIGLLALLAFPALLVITQIPGSPLAQVVEQGRIIGLTTLAQYTITSEEVLTSGGLTYFTSTTGVVTSSGLTYTTVQTTMLTSGQTTYTTTYITQTTQSITTSSTYFVTTTSGTGSITTTVTTVNTSTFAGNAEQNEGAEGSTGTHRSGCSGDLCWSYNLVPVLAEGGFALDIVNGDSVTRIPANIVTVALVIAILGAFTVYSRRHIILSWF
jgi:hypothetical protein